MKDAKRNAAASAAGQPKPATTRVSSPEKPVTKSMSQTTASSSSSKPAPTKEPAAGSKATGHTVAAKGHADAHDAGGAAAGGKQVPAVGHKIPATYRNHATRRPATDSSLPKGSSSIAVSDGQRPNRRPREAHAGPQATGAPSIPSSNTQAKSSQRVAKGDELPHRPAPHATPGPSREASSNPNVAAEIPGLKYEASDRVGNLRVFKDPPGKILTEEDEEPEREDMPQARDEDQVFIILSHCVHFGLRILENAKGRQALVAGGGKYVSAIQAKRIAYDKPAEDMPYWVAAFLHLIREDFYDLYATRTLDCANSAETERINWGTDLEEYKPKLAAAIYFNGTILDNTIHQAEAVKAAREKNDEASEENALSNYNRSLFYLSATVAHEVMHAFLGYLTGHAPVKTPDTMSHPPKVRGESGWWFEGNAFGGGIFMAENLEDPLGLRQAGTPYLLDKQFICTRISETFVQNVINDRLLMVQIGGGYGKIKCLESEHTPQPLDKLQEEGFGTTARLRVKIHENVKAARKETKARVAKTSVRAPFSKLELQNIDRLRKSTTVVVNAPLLPEKVAS